MIRIHYADISELSQLLKPLLDKSGVMMAYEDGNTLIVTDYASNIARIMEIIRAIDVEGEGTKLSVIPLQNASARDIAAALGEVLKTSPRAAKTARDMYKVVRTSGRTLLF